MIRYLALEPRFAAALGDLKARARAHPSLPAPPVLMALVAELLEQTFRVVSRERFGRKLARLNPENALTLAELLLRLEEAEAALAAFKALYYREIDDDDGEWWTFGER
ncbi:MAG TPA: hypothetical protein VL133_05415 [Devosia sp.]|nr:hypothetical protein [Devosia sp.]